jgi:hypothetical protein
MSIRAIANQITPKDRQYHLAQSSDVAHAAICGLKFKLPKIMGVVAQGNESFTSGSLAHEVLERTCERLQKLWRKTATGQEIFNEWVPYMDEVFNKAREKQEASPLDNDIEIYISQAESRLKGLAYQLGNKIKRQPAPIRIISEITITNTLTRHEGRIDAILEYKNHRETVDWKTYVEKGYSSYDRYQIIANGMLVNYRYGDADDDFTGNALSIITPSGIHHLQPTPNAINDIVQARVYILRVSDGERGVRAKLPYHRVCDFCPYHEPCQFYRTDTTTSDLRKILWSRRYAIRKKMSKTHISKYLAQSLSSVQMRQLGIAEFGYTIENIDLNANTRKYELTLRKDDEDHRLDVGNSVRVIALEPNIHVLASISCNGSVREVNGTRLLVEVNMGRPYQLQNFSIMLLKSDVDLTKRELASTDYVHRLPDGNRKKKAALALLGIELDRMR